MTAEVIIVMVTAPSAAAEQLVTRVVEERLAACGSIVPGVTSIYRWQGAVERADEVMIVLKTVPAAVERLTSRVTALHPYDVPEVIALPVTAGLDSYIDWIVSNTDA